MTVDGADSSSVTLVAVESGLADHVADLLDAAGIPSIPVPGPDGLTNVTVRMAHRELARATLNLVLPGLLGDDDEPGPQPVDSSPQRLSGRLIRRSDWVADPPEPDPGLGLADGGLRDGRQAFADALGIVSPAPDLASVHDDGDYIPPEPPPIPRGDVVSRFAWLGAIGGPVLLLLAGLFSLPGFAAGIGLAAFVAGFGVLVARKPDRPPVDDGWDNGAVV